MMSMHSTKLYNIDMKVQLGDSKLVRRRLTSSVSRKHGVSLVCREKLVFHEFSQRTLSLLNCICSLVDVGSKNYYQFYNVIAA